MNTDRIGGLLGLILAVLFWHGRGQWSHLSAMFPNTVLFVMGALSLALLVKSFVQPEVRPVFVEGNKTRIVVTAVSLLVWAVAIRVLGFYLASLVVFTFITLYIGSAGRRITVRNAGLWTVVAAVELAVLHFIFANLLAVQLPMGVFAQ